HQLMTLVGLKPDAVVGHSSGEILALAAAGVLAADRVLEDRLGELGAGFEGMGRAGLVAAAALLGPVAARGTGEAAGRGDGVGGVRRLAVMADGGTVESGCREAGVAGSVTLAVDNCPHQVVVAGPAGEVCRVARAVRGRGLLCEELPFRRAYHTPRFAAALG